MLSRHSLDAVIVLGASSELPLVLHGTAALVWDLLASPVEVWQLADELAEGFRGPRAGIMDEVSAVIKTLADAGAVIEAPGLTRGRQRPSEHVRRTR